MRANKFAQLLGARKNGKRQWLARCPAHADTKPSLAIKEGKKWILVTCWSQQCSTEAIVDAMGLKMSDLAYDAAIRQDPKIMAEARKKQAAVEERRRNLRVGSWILRFAEEGYTQEDHDDDMELACAAACALSWGGKDHWDTILRVSIERMEAARHCMERRMLPAEKKRTSCLQVPQISPTVSL